MKAVLGTSRHLCDQILPGLYLGPLEAEQAELQQLQQLGVTHILRLGCSALPKSHPKHLQHLEVNILDLPDSDLLAAVRSQRCLDYIHNAREAGAVLVHCIAGISRSATVVTAYLMCKDHISFDDALAIVRANRPRASPNSGFCEQLKFLETECDCNIELYTRAPDFLYFTPAERCKRDRHWLAQRKAALSGSPQKAVPYRVKRTNPAWPPTEG